MYVSHNEIKRYGGVNYNSDTDSFIETIIESVTNYIEKNCGDDRFGKRVFEAPSVDSNVIRYFNGNGKPKLYIGDLKELNTFTNDNVELTEDEDFYLYPLNAGDRKEPSTWVELVQPETRLNANSRVDNSNPYIFETAQKNIEISGKWRYSDIPPADIKLSALKLVVGVMKENIGDGDIRETKNVKLGDLSISYQDVSKVAHALSVGQILNGYKRKDISISSGIIKTD